MNGSIGKVGKKKINEVVVEEEGRQIMRYNIKCEMRKERK